VVQLAYINSELAKKTKTGGNEFFKKVKYPEYFQKYDEGMKRTIDHDKV